MPDESVSLDIAGIVETVLDAMAGADMATLDDVREADRLARVHARASMERAVMPAGGIAETMEVFGNGVDLVLSFLVLLQEYLSPS